MLRRGLLGGPIVGNSSQADVAIKALPSPCFPRQLPALHLVALPGLDHRGITIPRREEFDKDVSTFGAIPRFSINLVSL